MAIQIRLVETIDAPFIFELRNNPKLNKFLSSAPMILDDQVNWIKSYKHREAKQKEFYFLIEENGIKKGLSRIYNVNTFSFTIGSWLFNKCDLTNLPILTDLVISDFGFNTMNLPVLLFDVRKENRKVINYHLLKKPLIYYEDDLNNYYLIQRNDWNDIRKNMMSFFDIKLEFFDQMKEQLNPLYLP